MEYTLHENPEDIHQSELIETYVMELKFALVIPEEFQSFHDTFIRENDCIELDLHLYGLGREIVGFS